jgi:signal transduction histidine kinase
VAVLPPRAVETREPTDARAARLLEALRDFSTILTHSLQTDALLKQFLLLLREILGVNRAALFLRRHPSAPGADLQAQSRRLWAACAIGLPASLLEHFELSLDAGIGRHVCRCARILRSGSDEARGDLEIQKEFELLGTQVAIPVLDRESVIGVAVFDGRLTGEFFSNEELALTCHLLEELGLAVKNSWLHDQLAANHRTMADILNHLTSACLLVGRDLAMLHANRAAIELLAPAAEGRTRIEFADLPRDLGGRVFDAQRTGVAVAPFKYRFPDHPERIWLVSITPFPAPSHPDARAVLVLLEDFTRQELSHRQEIENANLRLVSRMAEQLAHAIGNSLVPISTFHQLAAEQAGEADDADSLAPEAGRAIRRINRFSRQMLYLAREPAEEQEVLPLEELLDHSFAEARSHLDLATARLALSGKPDPAAVLGDRPALGHAFSEIFLNGLQACPEQPQVTVHWRVADAVTDPPLLTLEFRDPGHGFTPEAARQATEPFFSTRNVGLGLGLTVVRKIVEAHGGRLEIAPSGAESVAFVRVSLPMGSAPPTRPAVRSVAAHDITPSP